MDHAEGYAALFADDRTAPYISDQGVLARAAAVAKLQEIAARGIADPTQIHFAIVRGGAREFLGYVAAHDLRGGICPISYAVLPLHRRQGVAQAALRRLLDYLARQAAAAWIEARTHPDNRASQATLLACGFEPVASVDGPTGRRDVFRKRR